jgi:hypothetical protein
MLAPSPVRFGKYLTARAVGELNASGLGTSRALPEARGEAERILQAARGYKEQDSGPRRLARPRASSMCWRKRPRHHIRGLDWTKPALEQLVCFLALRCTLPIVGFVVGHCACVGNSDGFGRD